MNVKSFNHYLVSGIVTIVHIVPDIEPDVVIYFRGYMLLSNVTSYKTTLPDYILLNIVRKRFYSNEFQCCQTDALYQSILLFGCQTLPYVNFIQQYHKILTIIRFSAFENLMILTKHYVI